MEKFARTACASPPSFAAGHQVPRSRDKSVLQNKKALNLELCAYAVALIIRDPRKKNLTRTGHPARSGRGLSPGWILLPA